MRDELDSQPGSHELAADHSRPHPPGRALHATIVCARVRDGDRSRAGTGNMLRGVRRCIRETIQHLRVAVTLTVIVMTVRAAGANPSCNPSDHAMGVAFVVLTVVGVPQPWPGVGRLELARDGRPR